ncbi:flagellar protein FlgJ-like protein [Buchnera aphidicola str. Bp (Baizongia pistaciae)]|uniref:Putative flagellar protein FlgJ homolog n=1 Tax=Buchnera aphidicola subsp. Baizongia pistaciae (strain Bp) TaxID=224915 RepID=FLGJ_BUCBP|nr:rod-binding protein [Buchnera aphidicola]Q89AH4.1 RecName: Full=Putative flagellar protein FlgJ homolog [Buchnera aphidicola str. Bp (Baizongia pistaciae)]AAO27038.1 flagellar protein FlgJ-like protein [Buchnera aphidicola str. Bp (Baizongia pistaciae)]
MSTNFFTYLLNNTKINSEKKYNRLIQNKNNQKHSIHKSSNISQQVESLFLYIMFTNMKKSSYKNEFWTTSNSESIYQNMYDQFITQTYDKKGIGLAKIIDNQIQKYKNQKHLTNLEIFDKFSNKLISFKTNNTTDDIDTIIKTSKLFRYL